MNFFHEIQGFGYPFETFLGVFDNSENKKLSCQNNYVLMTLGIIICHLTFFLK